MNIRLRAAREASGKTQKQVAKECDISIAAYQAYEYDKVDPTVRTALRIAIALHTTVEALFSSEKKED